MSTYLEYLNHYVQCKSVIVRTAGLKKISVISDFAL